MTFPFASDLQHLHTDDSDTLTGVKKRLGNDAALPLTSAGVGFVCRAAARAARRQEQGPWKLVLMGRLHNERGRNLIRRPVGSCLYTVAMKCTPALSV